MRTRGTSLALGLVLALVMAVSPPATAQSSDLQARQLFFAARTDRAVGRHASAVKRLEAVVRMLGAPNRRVLPALADSRYQLKDYIGAEQAVTEFFALSPPPDPALAETADMRTLEQSLVPLVAEQRARLARATGADLAPYRDYLAHHRHGHDADRVRARLKKQEQANQRATDDAAFARAQRNDTIGDYEAYLSRYPTGRHAKEARAALDAARVRADDAAFREASRRANAYAYKEYLRRWPRGRHVDEAIAQIARHDAAIVDGIRSRLLATATRIEGDASRERVKGGFKLGGGLVVLGGGIAIVATQALGSASWPLGGVGGGFGLFLAIRSRSNFATASDLDQSARSYRDRANSAVMPAPARGDRRLGLQVGFAF